MHLPRQHNCTLAAILWFINLASAICYFPDGTQVADTPCTDSTNESSCCGTGYACVGHPSGYFLCEATGDEVKKPDASEYVRGSCTDKSWRSSNCPSVCVDVAPGGGAGVGPCPNSDTLFYCNATWAGYSVDNCTTGNSVINLGTTPEILTTIGAVVSPTTATSTPLSTSTATTSPTPSADQGNNSSSSSTTIGAAVGASVGGVVLLVAAGLLVYYCRRKRRSSKPAVEPYRPEAPPAMLDQTGAHETSQGDMNKRHSTSYQVSHKSVTPVLQQSLGHEGTRYELAPAPGYVSRVGGEREMAQFGHELPTDAAALRQGGQGNPAELDGRY